MDKLLRDLLQIQSYSGSFKKMHKHIIKTSHELGGKVVVKKHNIYVVKGEPTAAGYPCVVAHTDTVHKIVPEAEYKVIFDEEHNVVYAYNPVKRKFTGVGGDDKVGIYIALKCLERFDSVKLCFFRDEEVGCKGSNESDLKFFEDCMYILQADRRGNADFITDISGPISSQEFQQDILDIVSNHGYKFQNGMSTDVGALVRRDVGVSCANMSCGYYNPHCDDEIIDINDMNNTMEMVFNIIGTLDKKYEFIRPKPEPKVYSSGYGNHGFDRHSNYGNYGGYGGYGTGVYGGYGGYGGYKQGSLYTEHKDPVFGSYPVTMPPLNILKTMTWYEMFGHCMFLMWGVEYSALGTYIVKGRTYTQYLSLHTIMKSLDEYEASMSTSEEIVLWNKFDEILTKADEILEKDGKKIPNQIRRTLPDSIIANIETAKSFLLEIDNESPKDLTDDSGYCVCGRSISKFEEEYRGSMCTECFNSQII